MALRSKTERWRMRLRQNCERPKDNSLLNIEILSKPKSLDVYIIFFKINPHQPDHSPILWLGDLSHAEKHQSQGDQGPIVSHAWPLIGQHWPRDLSTGLWLAETDHVTWIPVSLCVTGCESHWCGTFYIATWSLSG